jgi:hypothetical protein
MSTPNDLSWLANLPGQLVKDSAASGNSGQMNAGSNYTSATDPDFVRQLTQIRQYDPNASVVYAPPTEGNSSGTYSVSFDQGKMPQVPKAPDNQLWARPADFGGSLQRQMDTGGGSDAIAHSVIDPSKNVSSAYGTLTPGSNVTTTKVPTKPGLLDTIGPLAVGLAAGGLPSLFGGLPGAGAGIGGELAASAASDVGSSSLGTALTKGSMSIPQTAASNNPLQSLEGKIPSWLFTLLKSQGSGS